MINGVIPISHNLSPQPPTTSHNLPQPNKLILIYCSSFINKVLWSPQKSNLTNFLVKDLLYIFA